MPRYAALIRKPATTRKPLQRATVLAGMLDPPPPPAAVNAKRARSTRFRMTAPPA
jgi:hypothetical protein